MSDIAIRVEDLGKQYRLGAGIGGKSSAARITARCARSLAHCGQRALPAHYGS